MAASSGYDSRLMDSLFAVHPPALRPADTEAPRRRRGRPPSRTSSDSGTGTDRNRRYKCSYCPQTFTTGPSARRHEITHSENKQPYACDICGQRFTQSYTIVAHKRRYHEGSTPEERRKAKLAKKIAEVRELPLPPQSLRCRDCSAEFESQSLLQAHIVREHSQKLDQIQAPQPWPKDDESRRYACKICPLTFLKLSCYNQHKMDHAKWYETRAQNTSELHPVYRISAKVRDIFSRLHSSVIRNKYLKVFDQTIELPHCNICGKEQTTNELMRGHIQRSHPAVVSECDNSKIGIDSTNVIKPLKFSCIYCSSEYKHLYLLRLHIRNAHLKRRYKSKYCTREFGTRIIARRHEKIHETLGKCQRHRPRATEIAKLNPRNRDCELCGENCQNPFDYMNHFLRKHNLKCNITAERLEINPVGDSSLDGGLASLASCALCSTCGNWFKSSEFKAHLALTPTGCGGLQGYRQPSFDPEPNENVEVVDQLNITGTEDEDVSNGHAADQEDFINEYEELPEVDLGDEEWNPSPGCPGPWDAADSPDFDVHVELIDREKKFEGKRQSIMAKIDLNDARRESEASPLPDTIKHIEIKTEAPDNSDAEQLEQEEIALYPPPKISKRKTKRKRSRKQPNQDPMSIPEERKTKTKAERKVRNRKPKETVSKEPSTEWKQLEGRRIQCLVCEKVFGPDKLKLKYAKKSHFNVYHSSQKETFQCEYCPAQLANKGTYKGHVRQHTGEKPFECDICQAKFVTAPVLYAHKRDTHERKTYQCPICGKIDKYYANHITHKKRHETDKEESTETHCEECNKTFVHAKRLRFHMMNVHGIGRDAAETGKGRSRVYSCDKCSKIFMFKTSMRRHQLVDHPANGVTPKFFQCKLCDRGYGLVASIRSHLRSAHADKLWPPGLISENSVTITATPGAADGGDINGGGSGGGQAEPESPTAITYSIENFFIRNKWSQFQNK